LTFYNFLNNNISQSFLPAFIPNTKKTYFIYKEIMLQCMLTSFVEVAIPAVSSCFATDTNDVAATTTDDDTIDTDDDTIDTNDDTIDTNEDNDDTATTTDDDDDDDDDYNDDNN
jgi:hypothetical protein